PCVSLAVSSRKNAGRSFPFPGEDDHRTTSQLQIGTYILPNLAYAVRSCQGVVQVRSKGSIAEEAAVIQTRHACRFLVISATVVNWRFYHPVCCLSSGPERGDERGSSRRCINMAKKKPLSDEVPA